MAIEDTKNNLSEKFSFLLKLEMKINEMGKKVKVNTVLPENSFVKRFIRTYFI